MKCSSSTCFFICIQQMSDMEWLRQICELNKIPDCVRVRSLHKILDEEDPNHDVMKLAMMKVEMAVVLDITKPLREVTCILRLFRKGVLTVYSKCRAASIYHTL